MKGFDVMKRKLNVKDCVLSLVFVLAISAGIWLFASWIDVNAYNNHSENGFGGILFVSTFSSTLRRKMKSTSVKSSKLTTW